MAAGITEDQLEQLCLDWFRKGGYEYVYGPTIAHDGEAPEREDYKQILLTGRLLDALQNINPHIPRAALDEQVGSKKRGQACYIAIRQSDCYTPIMARKPRIHVPGGFYHVMIRGNAGQDIFFDSDDRYHFYLLLQTGIARELVGSGFVSFIKQGSCYV